MSLEDRVNDRKNEGLIKKAAKLGYAGTMAGLTTILSTSFVGTAGIAVGAALSSGLAIGSAIRGGKTLYNHVVDSLKSYANVNLFITPVFKTWDYIIPLVPGTGLLGFLAKGLFAATAFNAYFTTVARATGHLVNNYLNPFGIVKSVKDNFYNEWKRNAFLFSPAWFIAPQIPSVAGYPTFAPNAFVGGIYNAINPVPIKTEQKNYGHGNPYAAKAAAH